MKAEVEKKRASKKSLERFMSNLKIAPVSSAQMRSSRSLSTVADKQTHLVFFIIYSGALLCVIVSETLGRATYGTK